MRFAAFESLETRRLLASVTLVTHGYESDNTRPGWLDAMKDAIVARTGTGTAVYDLRIARDGSGNAAVESFTHLGGPGFTDADGNGDAVVMLDWADASGVISYTSTSVIAQLVKPYFVTAYPDLGIASPLAEVPIHLIGHSRGASVVSTLAMDLGRDGIEVDQVTTLDPHPTGSDPAVKTYANTRFADNDWQSGGFLTLGGSAIAGVHNIHLSDDVFDDEGYDSISDGGDHSNVHLWYQGTVDTSASAHDDSHAVPADWYPSSQGPRTATGFAYSLVAIDAGLGTARPADGVGTPFGGTAARTAITLGSAAQWPNIDDLHLTTATGSAAAGDSLAAQFDLYDNDSASTTVTLYLDDDTDPFDVDTFAHAITAANTYATSATEGHPAVDVPLYTGLVPAGTYRVLARITDGTNTRYAYAADALTLAPSQSDPVPLPDPAANLATAPNSGPDLTVALGATPAALLPGKKAVSFRVTVGNAGNTAGKGKATVNIYASADGTLDSADTLLATKVVSLNIAAGRSAAATLSLVTLPGIADGPYYLIAQVASPTFAETNVGNDAAIAASTTAITAPRLDLSGKFSATPILTARNKDTAVITLTNSGNIAAKGRVALQIQTPGGTQSVGSLLKSVSLAVGASVTLKVPLSIFPILGVLDGTFAFTGSLPDADLSNNAFTSPLTG